MDTCFLPFYNALCFLQILYNDHRLLKWSKKENKLSKWKQTNKHDGLSWWLLSWNHVCSKAPLIMPFEVHNCYSSTTGVRNCQNLSGLRHHTSVLLQPHRSDVPHGSRCARFKVRTGLCSIQDIRDHWSRLTLSDVAAVSCIGLFKSQLIEME